MPRPKRLTSLFARGRPAADRVTAAYASEPQPLPGSGPQDDSPWRRFFTSLVCDMELALLWGVLIALSAWFVFSTRPAIEIGELGKGAGGNHSALKPPPTGQFQLVSVAAREQLILAHVAIEPKKLEERAEPAEPAEKASTTAPVEQHVILPEPDVDPLSFVIVTGLPSDSRLSAGAKLPDTGDWAVPFGELDNLVIELPRDRDGAIRTQLDLKTRDGRRITSLTVEIREQPAVPKTVRNYNRPAAVKTPAAVKNPSANKTKARPTKVLPQPVKITPPRVNSEKTLGTKAVKAPVVKAPPVYPGDPPPGPAGAKPLQPPAPLIALPAPPLFAPDPKDTAAGGVGPKFKDDPRFTTLRGLGMTPEGNEGPTDSSAP